MESCRGSGSFYTKSGRVPAALTQAIQKLTKEPPVPETQTDRCLGAQKFTTTRRMQTRTYERCSNDSLSVCSLYVCADCWSTTAAADWEQGPGVTVQDNSAGAGERREVHRSRLTAVATSNEETYKFLHHYLRKGGKSWAFILVRAAECEHDQAQSLLGSSLKTSI